MDNQEVALSPEGGALRLVSIIQLNTLVYDRNPYMLQAFIDSVSRFGETLTYKGLIPNMRYVRLTPHRLELRALLLAITCRDTGSGRDPR
jgi:hypothetical protein